MSKNDEIGWSVRYWHSPNYCTYRLISDEQDARNEFIDLKRTYRRVELLKIDITVVERSESK